MFSLPMTLDRLVGSSAEPESISEFLMIDRLDESCGFFIRVDGSVMVLFEADPWPCYDKSDDQRARFAENTAQAVAGLPVGSLFFSLTHASKRIGDFEARFRKAGGERIPLLVDMENARIDFLKKHLHTPLVEDAGWTFQTRVYRTLLGVVIQPVKSMATGSGISEFTQDFMGYMKRFSGSETSDVTPTERRFIEEVREPTIREMRRISGNFYNSLRSAGIRVRQLGDADYQRFLRDLAWPKSGFKYRVHRSDEPLYNTTPISDMVIDTRRGSVEADGVVFRTATLKQQPDGHYPSFLTLPHASLDGGSVLEYLEHGWIAITAQVEEKTKARNLINKQLKAARKGLCLPGLRGALQQSAELGLFQLDNQGRTFLHTRCIAVAYGNTHDEALARIDSLRMQMSKVGCEMTIEEGKVGCSYFFQSLPGNAFPPIKGAKREVFVPDRTVVDLSPLMGRSRGGGSDTMLLQNRSGEPMLIGSYGGSNAHAIISGNSGAGKSVFAVAKAAAHLRNVLARVIYIDNGYSCHPLAKALGEDYAQWIDLYGQGVAINPFDGTKREGGSFARRVIQQLSCPSDQDVLTSKHLGLIDRILSEIYDAKMTAGVKFRKPEELEQKFPGQTVARMRKRLLAKYPDRRAKDAIRSSQNDATYDAYYLYWLTKYSYVTKGERKEKRIVSEKSLGSESRPWLKAQQYLWLADNDQYRPQVVVGDRDDKVVRATAEQLAAQREPGMVWVMSRLDNREQPLRKAGFQASHFTDYIIIDVETAADAMYLSGRGVEFWPWPGDEARLREQWDAELRISNPNATADQRRASIDTRLHALSPAELYDLVDGLADIQDEVLFRDFGARLQLYRGDGQAVTEEARLAGELLERLQPYFGSGDYARFFDDSNGIRFDKHKLTVIEIEPLTNELGTDNNITHAILGSLVHVVTRWARNPLNRHLMKEVYYEEFWNFLKAPVVAAPIDSAYRTARKMGLGCNFVTQSLEDMSKDVFGQKILRLALNRYFLQQDETTIPAVAAALRYTPQQTALLASIHASSPPGRYSEVLIDQRSTGVFDAGVFVADRWIYWLLSTKPDERTKRENLYNNFVLQGIPDSEAMRRAIQVCIEDEAGVQAQQASEELAYVE